MLIRDWETKTTADVQEVAAEVDGYRLWYRLPATYPVSRSADPFLAAALLPAMVRGEDLEVEAPLTASPRLLANLARLQEIFHTWNPALTTVRISAASAPAEALSGGAFSFFSAGVDSTYTFLKHADELSHVVFIHGFDFYDQGESYRIAVERNARFVAGHGVTLIPVETNFYPFGYRYAMSRNLSQGAALGSVALLLGFATAYVPASLSYNDLLPLGSHPLTDPLWSNEAVDVVHDGCEARRTDKIARIAASEAALANLRVCFEDLNVNCGHCTKCLRTMTSLTLMGVKAGPFPPLPPAAVLTKSATEHHFERILLEDNLALPVLGQDPQVAALRKSLTRALKRAKARRAIRDLDCALLDGRLRKLLVKQEPVVSVSYAAEE